jgi:O-antigen/teichoic acid export membrane protein
MSEYPVFAKRVGLIGIVRFIPRLSTIILLPILTKTFEASGYGIWSLILAGISLMMPLVMLGLLSAMVRFLPAKTDKSDFSKGFFSVFFTILFISVVISLLVFLSSNFIATTLFKDAAVIPIIKLASALIILEALNQTSLESFRTFGQIKSYSVLITIQPFMEVGLILLFVLSGFGVFGAVLALLITRGFILLISLVRIIRYCGVRLPDPSLLRSYLLFGLPLVPGVFFEIIAGSSDRYVIGFLRGPAEVGIYSAAYGLGSIVVFAIGPITYILSPTTSKLFDKNEIDEVKVYLLYSLKYFFMLCIPAVFGISILAKPVLYSLTTPEFVTLGIFITPLVAFSMIFEGVRAIYSQVLMLFKRTKIIGIASIIAGLTNLVLNIALIPYFGIIAAAATTLLSYGILGFMMYYYSRKYIKFELNLNFIAKSLLSSIVMIFAIWMLNPIGAITILLTIGIGAIVYFCMLFLLKGFKREELKIISEIVGLGRMYEKLGRK